MNFSILSLLAVVLGLVTAPVDHQISEEGQSDVAKATAAFNRSEYVRAAGAFDHIYAEWGGSAFLHYAALAWAAAGDDTRAILRWHQFKADPGSQGLPEAKDAGDFLAEAYKRTTAVGISLTPGSVSGQVTTLSLERLDKEEQAITVTVTKAAVDEYGRHVVFLAPGRWSLSAETVPPGYAAQVQVEVSAQQAELETVLVLRPRMGELAVQIEGLAEGERAKLVLKNEAGIGEPIRMTLPPADGLADVPAGAWTYEVTSPRGGQLKGRIDITPSETTTLQLTVEAVATLATLPVPPPADDTPCRQRKFKLDLGLGLGALAVGGAGVGTFVAGYRVLGLDGLNTGPAWCRGESAELRRECAIAVGTERSSAGASLMGSSLGLATNAILVRAKIRHRLYWIPWSSGLVVTAGGIVWFQSAHSRFLKSSFLESDGKTPDSDRTVAQAEIDRLYWRREVPASVFMGFGAGLLAGASVALIAHRIKGKPRAARKTVSIVPCVSGFSLQGKF